MKKEYWIYGLLGFIIILLLILWLQKSIAVKYYVTETSKVELLNKDLIKQVDSLTIIINKVSIEKTSVDSILLVLKKENDIFKNKLNAKRKVVFNNYDDIVIFVKQYLSEYTERQY